MYLLIIMNIFWAASYTFMKWGMEYAGPIHLLFARIAVSFVILFCLSFRYWKTVPLRTVFRCALLGAIIAVAHGLGMVGMDKSYAIDGALLYALEPIIAIVFARIMLNEKMDGWRVLSLTLALIGFFILSNITTGSMTSNLTLIGNSLMLIGIFADGLFSPVAKPALANHPSRAILSMALFFTTLFLLPFALISPLRNGSFSWQAFISVFYLGVICTSIGWTLWLHFLKKFPVNVIAMTVFIQPVVSPFISHFTIGEQIGTRVWFGGCVILAAVLIAILKRKSCEEDMIAEAVIH